MTHPEERTRAVTKALLVHLAHPVPKARMEIQLQQLPLELARLVHQVQPVHPARMATKDNLVRQEVQENLEKMPNIAHARREPLLPPLWLKEFFYTAICFSISSKIFVVYEFFITNFSSVLRLH